MAVSVGVSLGEEVVDGVCKGVEVGLTGMKDWRSDNEQANAKSPNNAIQPIFFIQASFE